MPITVLIAEDFTIVRRAIRRVLEEDPEIELVGETANFAETVAMTEKLKPRIVVMDLHMPDGANVTPLTIKSMFSGGATLLVAISIWDDDDAKALAASFGAVTLLDKATLGINLLPAIKSLAFADGD
jgi:DNA-binding NarL/FixJ family response regulator